MARHYLAARCATDSSLNVTGIETIILDIRGRNGKTNGFHAHTNYKLFGVFDVAQPVVA